ncbi:hypothetical protein A5893_05510 [Pedobacter psychrophilus]|uniref:Outer membrane protein beta-barrel domain-containing protein n=1 Tax=Pedobacter psychrophilus TaxID=1826909 RepID=A0A179DH49_9SPHI|nr:outer membrane beta-barrel protein [Pedobacter psychrophilus]OAQ40406.1 hypothetical protein A5893_05510 [Pedobacter psychrophilus]
MLGGGPYLAYAIAGNAEIYTSTITNVNSFVEDREKRDINYGNEMSDDFSPFDLGLNFLVGYQIKKGWLLNFNYSQGIANILPKKQRVNEIKAINGAFQICLGYEF